MNSDFNDKKQFHESVAIKHMLLAEEHTILMELKIYYWSKLCN